MDKYLEQHIEISLRLIDQLSKRKCPKCNGDIEVKTRYTIYYIMKKNIFGKTKAKEQKVPRNAEIKCLECDYSWKSH